MNLHLTFIATPEQTALVNDFRKKSAGSLHTLDLRTHEFIAHNLAFGLQKLPPTPPLIRARELLARTDFSYTPLSNIDPAGSFSIDICFDILPAETSPPISEEILAFALSALANPHDPTQNPPRLGDFSYRICTVPAQGTIRFSVVYPLTYSRCLEGRL